jgi:hypothetical protein
MNFFFLLKLNDGLIIKRKFIYFFLMSSRVFGRGRNNNNNNGVGGSVISQGGMRYRLVPVNEFNSSFNKEGFDRRRNFEPYRSVNPAISRGFNVFGGGGGRRRNNFDFENNDDFDNDRFSRGRNNYSSQRPNAGNSVSIHHLATNVTREQLLVFYFLVFIL